MRSYRPEELFDERGALVAELAALGPGGRPAHGRQPARQRRPAAARPAPARLPRLRRRRAGARRRRRPRRRACSARSCATRCRMDGERRTLPRLRPRRDRVEPPRTPCSRRPTAQWMAETLPTDDHLAPDGRVMEVLSEHLCQGWLEGYLLTGRHGLFSCYEAFIHIVDSMFNQHAKWLKVTRRHPVAAADRLAELPADLARLAPGPQRLQPPGPRLHRPRRQQEGRDRPRLPAAGRELPAVGRRPLPAQPRLRQRHRRRQAARPAVPDDGRGGRALHARDRHLGVGRNRRRPASPTSCSACAGDIPTLETVAAARAAARAPAGPAGAGRQRRRPHAPAARDRAPARPARPRVRRALHRSTGR